MAAPLPFAVPFIRFADVVHWQARYESPARRLYDHELFYVVSGNIRLELEDKAISLRADSLTLIPPRVRQRFRAGPETSQIHLGIHFDWLQRKDSASFATFRPAVEPYETELFRERQTVPGWDLEKMAVLDLRGRPRVRQLMLDTITAHGAGTPTLRWQAGALLAVAIAQISHEAGITTGLAASGVGADAVRRVHLARERLEEPRTPPVSIATAAAEVGWSSDHLGRMFRAVLGLSPSRVQMEARLRRARQMLNYGNITLTEIAYACGFYDVSHFVTSFKKETGVTPREFAESAARTTR